MADIALNVMILDLTGAQPATARRNVVPLRPVPEEQQSGLETIVRRVGTELYDKRVEIVALPRLVPGRRLPDDLFPLFFQSPYLFARTLATGFLRGVAGAVVATSPSRREEVEKIQSFVPYNWQEWGVSLTLLTRVAHVTLRPVLSRRLSDRERTLALPLSASNQEIQELCDALRPLFL